MGLSDRVRTVVVQPRPDRVTARRTDRVRAHPLQARPFAARTPARPARPRQLGPATWISGHRLPSSRALPPGRQRTRRNRRRWRPGSPNEARPRAGWSARPGLAASAIASSRGGRTSAVQAGARGGERVSTIARARSGRCDVLLTETPPRRVKTDYVAPIRSGRRSRHTVQPGQYGLRTSVLSGPPQERRADPSEQRVEVEPAGPVERAVGRVWAASRPSTERPAERRA
jgi:hypothetical protein